MVSVNPNPTQSQGFNLEFTNSGMPLPGVNPIPPVNSPVSGGSAVPMSEDHSKKVRKPYTITKSRESWTEQEHDKFLEALQLFDRDWKKIEGFIGSKTVIQIRSHAQKYFLKVQKSGSNERVPPPRPKRKAAHPYPQKASKTAPAINQSMGQYQNSPVGVLEPGYVYHHDPSSVLTNQSGSAPASSWTFGSVPVVNTASLRRDDAALAMPSMTPTGCCSSSNESGSTWPTAGATDQTTQGKRIKAVVPDFAQVYSFIGSVFDPNARDHLQRLKTMDPINVETVLLLMRNLSVNLLSPEFEEYRKLFSSYDVESGKTRSCSHLLPAQDNSKTVIPAVY
ncbi:protein REVEILLE 5-like isoform X1 [Chenopodium quinoa]|uniref:protein REVEILLE 5-like isoform X1 n=1 Tax=Chenopodium quinoa TaxID=63459 RepID=UPI000B7802F3|nr:protein REVEILLE 5-like isoform X1 [Chenopodium quinoa]